MMKKVMYAMNAMESRIQNVGYMYISWWKEQMEQEGVVVVFLDQHSIFTTFMTSLCHNVLVDCQCLPLLYK